jgi:uncharacterized repeat protein (TIGR01451 family)
VIQGKGKLREGQKTGRGRRWRGQGPLLAGLLWLFLTGSARALTCASATASGPNGANEPTMYQNVCWLDLTGFNSTTARSAAGQAYIYTLPDGSNFSFTLNTNTVPGSANCANNGILVSAIPIYNGAALGTADYLAIANSPALVYNAHATGCSGSGTLSVTLSNLQLTNPAGIANQSFQLVAADAESTNLNSVASTETLQFTTTGGTWQQIDKVSPPSGSTPTLAIAGATATITGTGAGNAAAYLLASSFTGTGTKTVTGSLFQTNQSQQGIAFGLVSGRVTLNKIIATPGRVAASDQFTYKLANVNNVVVAGATQNSTGTAAANSNTTLALIANVFNGNPLTLSESMAVGSASPFSFYRPAYSCTSTANAAISLTPGSSFTLPGTFVPSLGGSGGGQIYACTFVNTPPVNVSITKSDSRTTYTPGGGTTYTIVVTNTGGALPVTGFATPLATVSDLLPKGLTIAAPGVSCTAFTGGAGCVGSATNGATGTAGTGVLDVLSGIGLSLPSSSSVTISVPVVYSSSAANY